MAAKKAKKRTKKAARAKKAPARKARKAARTGKAKKTKVAAKKAVKAAARTTKAKRAPAKKARKAPAKRKQIVGEGDYAAAERFDKEETRFVRKNKAKIADLGKAAEKALEGPEGDALREAEATAADRSRDIF